MPKKEAVDPAAQLIKDPRFLFRAGKKIGELGLVGEVRNRLIVFLAALTMILMDQRRKASTIVTGPSGSGKTRLIEVPLKLFPPDSVIMRASFTRKALAYGKESLDKRVLYVNEYRGGREAQYLLRLLQSEGAIAHEYTSGGKTSVTLRLGTPVVMTTTTDETIFEDDATRFLAIGVDETAKQNLAVYKADLGGKKESEEPPLKVWQQAVRLVMANYTQPFIFPAWFNYVAEQVPRDQVRARRDWKRFLGLMEAIALCTPNPQRRNRIMFEDYCIAHIILNSALSATACSLNENELRVQKAVRKLNEESGRSMTIKEVREHLGWEEPMAYKYVSKAVEHKLIEYESGTHAKNVKRLLPVGQESSRFLPHPARVLEHVKELAGPVRYVHPLTGKIETIQRRGRSTAA